VILSQLVKGVVEECVADYSLWERVGGIEAVFSERGVQDFDEGLKALREDIKASLLAQLRELAYLIYRHMDVSGDWTDAGRDCCEQAFGRCELQLGPRGPWGYTERSKLQQYTADKMRELGVDTLTLSELKEKVEHFKVNCLGLSFLIHDFMFLNRFLAFIGIPWILQGGVYGPYYEFILGEGTFEVKGDYRVFVLRHEVLRSPTTIMQMAAVIGEREIFVRDEAMVSVFDLKWASFLPYAFDTTFQFYGSEQRISAYIRQQVFCAYGIKNKVDLEAQADQFIFDLKETVLNHELGHGIIQYHQLAQDIAPIAETTKMLGESIITALLEVLADFAPRLRDVKGPLQNMVDISKTDEARATRMFWMYLSDVWFFDTPDEYMYVYSEILTWVMGSVIGKDRRIEFSRLDQAINDPNGIVAIALANVIKVTEVLRDFAEDAEYLWENRPVSFDDFCLNVVLKEEAKTPLGQVSFSEVFMTDDMRDYSMITLKWSKVFEYLYSVPEYRRFMQTVLEDAQKEVQEQVFMYMSGRKLDGSFRGYIFKLFDF